MASSRRSPTLEEQRLRMVRKCNEQLTMLEAAQERMHRLSSERPDLVIKAASLAGQHTTPAGSGSFACVWASKCGFARKPGQPSDDDDATALLDQDNATTSPFRSCLKVLQLPIGVASRSRHWPISTAQMRLPLSQRNLNDLYNAFDELRWQRLFIQEAEAMVACEGHPSIARILGWCLDDSLHLPTLVMEYAGPANLWHTLFGSSRPRPQPVPLPMPLTWKQAASVYFQLLDAVDYMHNRLPGQAGVFCLHRDVSPGNVVVSWPQGLNGLPQIKLVDFGLSELMTMDEPGKQEWLQAGVAVGPDVMFIDPLMWVCRLYGRGTDIFGVAHLLMLMMFGTRAAHNHNSPSPSSGPHRTAEFNAICMNRTELRNIMRMTPAEALDHPTCPLLPRWRTCPEGLLRILMSQCVLCTTAGEDALRRRPSSRQLLTELAAVRPSLPSDLALWVPTSAQLSAGIWVAPRPTVTLPASQKK